jgi:hypothetical protein
MGGCPGKGDKARIMLARGVGNRAEHATLSPSAHCLTSWPTAPKPGWIQQ